MGPPDLPGNIELHVGWFEDSLPRFLETHDEPVAFMHMDCDLYSSTRTVLELMAPRMVPGTVLVFDEFFNYTFWRDHEYKAFTEFVSAHNVRYEFLTYAERGFSVGVKITGTG